MINYHAVMIDETGCEFGVDIKAPNRAVAYEELHENYPESRVAQLESPQDTAEREAAMHRRISAEMDGNFDQWEYEQEWG